MKLEIRTAPPFDRNYKRFQRKFASLPNDLLALEEMLLTNPESGTALGSGLYKIRLKISSKGGGKSGGFRVITYLVRRVADQVIVYLLTMYDKSEEQSIDKAVLLRLAQKYVDALKNDDL